MIQKCIALLVSTSLIATSAAAQITIRIPGVPNISTGARTRLAITLPGGDDGNTAIGRTMRLPPPGAASGYNRNVAALDEARRKQLYDWQQAAAKGDLLATYKVGRAYEMGATSWPSGRPDIGQAIGWYNRAVAGGNLNAMYHLGTLLVTRNAMAVDRSGNRRPDIAGGRRMMDYAVQHGYQPATDTVRTVTASNGDNTAALAVGALAALIVVGAMAGGSSSPGNGDPSSADNQSRSCRIPFYRTDGGIDYRMSIDSAECNRSDAIR